jgi:hypothetical protein
MQGGTAPQDLMASGGLGVPLLVARAVDELTECVEFDAAPVVSVDEHGVTIRTAEVKSSLAGGRRHRRMGVLDPSRLLERAWYLRVRNPTAVA